MLQFLRSTGHWQRESKGLDIHRKLQADVPDIRLIYKPHRSAKALDVSAGVVICRIDLRQLTGDNKLRSSVSIQDAHKLGPVFLHVLGPPYEVDHALPRGSEHDVALVVNVTRNKVIAPAPFMPQTTIMSRACIYDGVWVACKCIELYVAALSWLILCVSYAKVPVADHVVATNHSHPRVSDPSEHQMLRPLAVFDAAFRKFFRLALGWVRTQEELQLSEYGRRRRLFLS